MADELTMNSGLLSQCWLDHHQGERSGQHRSPAPATRRRRTELRAHYEDAVIGRVEPHVARPGRRLDGFNRAILIGGVLVDYGERAVRVGSERVARSGVVA